MSQECAALILIVIAGGSNVVRDVVLEAPVSLSLVLLVVLAMLAGKSLTDTRTQGHYRCLRCGAQRPDMHSKWCEDRDDGRS